MSRSEYSYVPFFYVCTISRNDDSYVDTMIVTEKNVDNSEDFCLIDEEDRLKRVEEIVNKHYRSSTFKKSYEKIINSINDTSELQNNRRNYKINDSRNFYAYIQNIECGSNINFTMKSGKLINTPFYYKFKNQGNRTNIIGMCLDIDSYENEVKEFNERIEKIKNLLDNLICVENLNIGDVIEYYINKSNIFDPNYAIKAIYLGKYYINGDEPIIIVCDDIYDIESYSYYGVSEKNLFITDVSDNVKDEISYFDGTKYFEKHSMILDTFRLKYINDESGRFSSEIIRFLSDSEISHFLLKKLSYREFISSRYFGHTDSKYSIFIKEGELFRNIYKKLDYSTNNNVYNRVNAKISYRSNCYIHTENNKFIDIEQSNQIYDKINENSELYVGCIVSKSGNVIMCQNNNSYSGEFEGYLENAHDKKQNLELECDNTGNYIIKQKH